MELIDDGLPRAFGGGSCSVTARDWWWTFYSNAPGGALIDRMSMFATAVARISYRLLPRANVPASSFAVVAGEGPNEGRVSVERGPIFSRIVAGSKDPVFSDPYGDGDVIFGTIAANQTLHVNFTRPLLVPRDWCLHFASPYATFTGFYSMGCAWRELPDPMRALTRDA